MVSHDLKEVKKTAYGNHSQKQGPEMVVILFYFQENYSFLFLIMLKSILEEYSTNSDHQI